MRKQLTDQMIEKVRPPASGRLEIFDSVVPAMALRVTAGGAKSFVVRCRVKGLPNPIRVTLGDAAIKITPARQAASDILRECRAGNDPREAIRAKAKEATQQGKNTFSAVAESFITEHISTLRDADHAEAEIRRHLIAPWAKRSIASITDEDVAEVIQKVKKESGPHVARRVLAYAKMLFHWATKPGRPVRLRIDPCVSLKPADFGLKLVPRQVVLAADHIRFLWSAAPSLPEPFGPFVKMLLLCIQRRGEVAEMAWPELDLDRERVWIIPAERMKAGRSHEVPLTDKMVTLLKALHEKRGAEGDYVFSTTLGERPISGFSKAKLSLDTKVAELQVREHVEASLDTPLPELPGWQFHDLRRTGRTGLGAIPSIPHDIRELVIAHVPPALVKTYDLHAYREEKREALTLWGHRLRSIVEPKSADPIRVAAE